MLNHSASLVMSTSVLKAVSGKLDIKRHSPSILYFPPQGPYHICLVLLATHLFCFDICKTDLFTVIWSKFPIFLGDFSVLFILSLFYFSLTMLRDSCHA